MGKGNKNRNGFYYFMLDFKNQQGRNFRSMSEVSDAAGPHWETLSPQEKQKYDQMAKRSRENSQKQTSGGEFVDDVLREKKEKEDREMAMKKDIDNIVRKGVNTKTIADQYFFVMHINDFCFCETQMRYIPAEIALGKFNLRNGIIGEDVYDSLVQPGPLPLGYSATARSKSDETHQIQHMGDANNTEEVLMALITKLTEEEGDTYPPIFVSEKNLLVVENVLNQMCDDFGHPNIFNIYSLQYLLFSLKNNLSKTGTKVWPTISVSILQFDKDVYAYCGGIACAYHEKAEIPVHCSRSRVIRWCYIVCDNCNIDLNLPLIKGRHVPFNALTEEHCLAIAHRASSKKDTPWEAPIAGNSKSSYDHNDSASEISTIVDDSETSSYHGFDSDIQTANDEDSWHQPRRTVKYRTPISLSQQSNDSSQPSQFSSTSEFIPGRRPLSQSSANPGVARPSSMRGRGRGRGILQNRPPL